MVKITYKGETRNILKKYLPDTLSKAERQKQIKLARKRGKKHIGASIKR